jgi:hypothetical protein
LRRFHRHVDEHFARLRSRHRCTDRRPGTDVAKATRQADHRAAASLQERITRMFPVAKQRMQHLVTHESSIEHRDFGEHDMIAGA